MSSPNVRSLHPDVRSLHPDVRSLHPDSLYIGTLIGDLILNETLQSKIFSKLICGSSTSMNNKICKYLYNLGYLCANNLNPITSNFTHPSSSWQYKLSSESNINLSISHQLYSPGHREYLHELHIK